MAGFATISDGKTGKVSDPKIPQGYGPGGALRYGPPPAYRSSGGGGGGGGGGGLGPLSTPYPPPPTVMGGGGGTTFASAASSPAPMSLEDYISGNFLYNSQEGENSRMLQDFDAETLRMQQETEAQQNLQRSVLQQVLNNMGIESAGGLASRGLLRSGINFQEQDKINQYGVQQENGIAQMLTGLLSQRTGGRLSQEQANRQALNQVINQLTSQFNASQAVAA